ncbi:Mucin-associated surface protein (MASP) [Trypanosoma cruzi]|uniref:Mucin-associated surface protein (MASP), putative n=2 Tax=Trypanosoma cruzi TaxID=5693 RepID=Q4E5W8_TRYCC|nr:mucin-associated surface protein (MASP), putative [Trypanosoma cruzi]EAO00142.1 mucin-associated surface protein (MASP), putative [Trypanosoma cruzi]PWV21227.1 Mucin-associated surface protein (MASP) [Trypanosoma cruzi]RNC40477.1 mucin-associated surface protein (MASP) [Trypanosoma cruzi]|eukprot:XP_821993.1 mucin-associated surface protein (MASP) [Trypanosoma cruzi strain CL Brener]
MAMMTGRVPLVCALCVLWCGAGGRCDEEERAVSGSGDGPPPGSAEHGTPRKETQELKVGAPGVIETASPPSLKPTGEDKDDDDEDDAGGDEDDNETDETKEKRREGQSNKGGTVLPDTDSREENLTGSGQETGQPNVPAGGISPSGSQLSNANPLRTEVEEKNDTDKRPPAVKNALTTVNGEQTLLGGIAGGNLPSPPEDGVDSRKQDGEDTTSEGKKNAPPPETAATPKSHRDEGPEGTGEDTKATTVTANTTDTTNTQNSDSSTAASHTTSPLLLLLVVACAAAAVVAA